MPLHYLLPPHEIFSPCSPLKYTQYELHNMTPMIMASYKIFYLFIICNVCCKLYPFYQSEATSVPPTNTTTSEAASEIGRWPQYDFSTIEEATNKFSQDNRLGEGGFRVVYKGTLANGQAIAVKRLLYCFGRDVQEFKNEVKVLASFQHRNLVRLLGFCVQGEKMILVYKYVPNKSLDYILFDPEKQRQLDWIKRYKIVKGIARGIKYLHEDWRFKIIHCNFKASNVLLDNDMNPKITDFGMAPIFMVDQTQENARRVIGTFGYMAPEYAMKGEFSVKSDVYSFGVLLMEIISVKKDVFLQKKEKKKAWKLWEDGEPLELLDPTIRESYTPSEVMRCIDTALLCVQENFIDRPSMSSIVIMLENYSMTLPTPL